MEEQFRMVAGDSNIFTYMRDGLMDCVSKDRVVKALFMEKASTTSLMARKSIPDKSTQSGQDCSRERLGTRNNTHVGARHRS